MCPYSYPSTLGAHGFPAALGASPAELRRTAHVPPQRHMAQFAIQASGTRTLSGQLLLQTRGQRVLGFTAPLGSGPARRMERGYRDGLQHPLLSSTAEGGLGEVGSCLSPEGVQKHPFCLRSLPHEHTVHIFAHHMCTHTHSLSPVGATKHWPKYPFWSPKIQV